MADRLSPHNETKTGFSLTVGAYCWRRRELFRVSGTSIVDHGSPAELFQRGKTNLEENVKLMVYGD